MTWSIDKFKPSAPWRAIRGWRQRQRMEDIHRRALQGRRLPLPKGLVLEPTQRCNLACVMCCHRQHHTERSCQEMDTAETIGLVHKLRRQHRFRTLGFIGSEPFVRNDLEKLMLAAVDMGMEVSVQTNATLLTPERVNIWASQKKMVRNFGASLEGPSGVDDQIRPGHDVFIRSRRGIELAVAAGLPVTVSILILDQNREQLPQLIHLLREAGVESVDVSLVVNHAPSAIDQTARMSGFPPEHICITSRTDLEYQTTSERLLRYMIDSLALADSLGMEASTSPEGYVEHFQAIRDGSLRNKKRLVCGAMETVRVDPSGGLIHCQHFRRSFGNLNKVGLEEAWNSPELVDFRRRLAENNLFPICVDCCRMRILPS